MRLSVGFAISSTLSVLACGGDPGVTEPSATSDGPIIIESSPETRSQLGVQRWIVDKNAPDGVEGYDAADQPVFKFAYRVDTAQRVYQYRAQGTFGLESMDISVGANDTPNVRSTIGDSAVTALNSMIADLKKYDPESAPSMKLSSQSLRPLDLVQSDKCVLLVQDCRSATGFVSRILANGAAPDSCRPHAADEPCVINGDTNACMPWELVCKRALDSVAKQRALASACPQKLANAGCAP